MWYKNNSKSTIDPKNARFKSKPKELIYGINPINSLIIQDPSRFIKIFVINSDKSGISLNNSRITKICEMAEQQGISLQQIKGAKSLDHWFSDPVNHQGIFAEITPTPVLAEKDLFNLVENSQDKKILFMVLDHIQDPRNLGACIRNAAAFGVDVVILPKDRTCDLTATVRKAASGAVDLVKIAKVNNLFNTLQQLKKIGVWIISLGASHNQELSSLDLTIPIALVLGGEGAGVKDLIKRNSDFLAKIPMYDALGINSLNLSVAAGICLYEVFKQRYKNIEKLKSI